MCLYIYMCMSLVRIKLCLSCVVCMSLCVYVGLYVFRCLFLYVVRVVCLSLVMYWCLYVFKYFVIGSLVRYVCS